MQIFSYVLACTRGNFEVKLPLTTLVSLIGARICQKNLGLICYTWAAAITTFVQTRLTNTISNFLPRSNPSVAQPRFANVASYGEGSVERVGLVV